MWSETEREKSSTWRELKALLFGVEAFGEHLRERYVVWHTDNQAVSRIAEKGSMVIELNKMAFSLFQLCTTYDIRLKVVWVWREFNQEADSLSRVFDTDDWSISDEIFEYATEKWGPFTVDRFASNKNSKLPRFNSRFWNPGSEQV